MKETIIGWTAPTWHSDFGDPQIELQILKKVCLALFIINNKLEFNLDCYEEGYMRVKIISGTTIWGELHVVDVNQSKVGLFTTEEELYFSISD